MLYLVRWLQQTPAVWLVTTAPGTHRSLKPWERAAGWPAGESGCGPDHQSLHSQTGSCRQHKTCQEKVTVESPVTCLLITPVMIMCGWAELWPVKRWAVYRVDGAAARPKWEDGWGSQCHTVALGGCCSQCLGWEGTSEQQATLGAHQEGVRVPGRQGQGGDAHSAATSGLWATESDTCYSLYNRHCNMHQQFENHSV